MSWRCHTTKLMRKAQKFQWRKHQSIFFKFVLAGEVIHIGSRIVFYAILHCCPGAFDLVYENKEGFVHFTNLTNPEDFITPKPGKGSIAKYFGPGVNTSNFSVVNFLDDKLMSLYQISATFVFPEYG